MVEKCRDFGCAQLAWMTGAVKAYEPDNSGHIRLFGAEQIVETTECGANLIQETGRLRPGAASLTVLVESSADDMSA